jgi:hypothetical protein
MVPGHKAEEGALAGAVGADEGQAIALPDFELGTAEHLVPAVGIVDLGSLDEEGHVKSSSDYGGHVRARESLIVRHESGRGSRQHAES